MKLDLYQFLEDEKGHMLGGLSFLIALDDLNYYLVAKIVDFSHDLAESTRASGHVFIAFQN